MIWIRKCHAGWNSVPVSQRGDQMDCFSKPVCLCTASTTTEQYWHQKYDNNARRSNGTPAALSGERCKHKVQPLHFMGQICLFNYRIWVEQSHSAFTFISLLLKINNRHCSSVRIISQYDALNKGYITKTVKSTCTHNSNLLFKAARFHLKATCNYGYHIHTSLRH